MSFLGKNVKQNTVTFTPQSADPVNPAEGMQFRSDGTSREEGMWEYKNGEWQKLGSGSGAALNFIDDNSATFEGSIGEWTTTSFRKTIIGSSSSLDSINITSHGMSTGDEVIYRAGSTPIVGLTDGNTYYVLNVDPDEVQLSSTPFGSALNLSTNGGDGILAPAKPVGVESASTALSLVLDDTDPLNGSRSLLMQKNDTLSGESEAFSLVIPVPEGYHNRNLVLEFIKNTVGTNNYADNNYEVYVKDNSGNFQFLSGTNIGLLNNNENFRGFINAQTPASLELLIYVKTTNTNVMYVRADDFILAPAVPNDIVIDMSQDINLAGSGNFTGGSIRVSKVGKSVTISYISALTHASLSQPASAVGVIPEWARPEVDQSNTYTNSASAIRRVIISSTGQLTAEHRNYSGTLDATTISAPTISYTVPDSAGSVSALASNSSLEFLTATSSIKTPTGSQTYMQMTGSSLVLKAGKSYDLVGQVNFGSSGSPAYAGLLAGWFGANGADSASVPTLLSAVSTLQVTSNTNMYRELGAPRTDVQVNDFSLPIISVRVLSDTTVYLVPWANMTTAANSRVTTYLTAKEIPFSNTALMALPEANLYLETGNGHGSTNTHIRRYTNIRNNNLGSLATYADSATLGMSVTVNVKSRWMVKVKDVRIGGTMRQGVSVNSVNNTTSIQSLTYAQGRRFYAEGPTSGVYGNDGDVLTLNAGDIVRSHGDSASDTSAANSVFSMTFLGFVK